MMPYNLMEEMESMVSLLLLAWGALSALGAAVLVAAARRANRTDEIMRKHFDQVLDRPNMEEIDAAPQSGREALKPRRKRLLPR